jgi:hypothetical protein
MKIEITKDQQQMLINIINQVTVRLSDARMLEELLKAIVRGEQDDSSKK